MPGEEINIFVSNIYTIAIFIAFFAAIFLGIFFVSRIFIYRSRKSGQGSIQEKQIISSSDKQTAGLMMVVRKDNYIKKNLFVTGLLLIFAILFILLILLSFLFATQFRMDGSFYMIFAIIFLIIAITIYAMKSKLLER